MPEETVPTADLVACNCGPCQKRKGDRYAISEGTIHSYSSQPRGGWRVRRTSHEVNMGIESATFGVELETTLPEVRYPRNLPGEPYIPTNLRWAVESEVSPQTWVEREEIYAARNEWNRLNSAHLASQERRFGSQNAGLINGDEAVGLAAPRGFWHSKHDSSVSGPEFASQPASLAYWRSQHSAISGMMKALLHGGMRSHDGDTCGLHINIGTDTFGRPMPGGNEKMQTHLERFAKLMTMNQRWTTRMSQRTHASASQWANYSGLQTDTERTRWAFEIACYGYASQHRYCILNASNQGRIECRIPRGTLRIDRFYAKLEWIASAIEYTRNEANVVQISAYMRWCEQSGEYPALVKYMRERFSGERFGSVPTERDELVPA